MLTNATESKRRNSSSAEFPTQETRRLPLGLLLTRMYQLHHRHNRLTFAKRAGAAGSCSHRLINGIPGRSQDNHDSRWTGDTAIERCRRQRSRAAHLSFSHGLGYHWNDDRSAFGCPEFDTDSIVWGCILRRRSKSLPQSTHS